MPLARSAQELEVYRLAYTLAMDIFALRTKWPPEERYALTDQVRRSSRSVCANLSEAWGKRRYEAHFVSKLTDADAENSETHTWLDFAADCGYVDADECRPLRESNRSVGRMIGAMLKAPQPFLIV